MKLFNTLTKKIVAAVAIIAAVVGISGAALAGFGPDRPTKDWNVDKTGFDHVVYNSFINIDGKGDERNFLEGVQVGRDASWIDPINNVEAGEIEVKLYMHNNADTSLNESGVGVAKNVIARVEIPGGKTQTKDLKGFIDASNAAPTEVTDTLTIAGANGGTFELEPVIGSGKLIENGNVIGTVDVNELVTTGVKLSDQNGCSKYVREITFRVKTKVASWTLTKEVSPYNKGQYAKSITALPGDKVDYLIDFKNIGNVTLDPVTIGDSLPAGVTYVPGSLQWLSAHTNWKWQNADNTNMFVGGANIFGYNGFTVDAQGKRVYAEAFLRFTAQIAPVTELACGRSVLTNKAFAKPTGYGTTEASADINVDRTCEVVVVKECKSLEFVKINRSTFDFTATANVSNATVTSYVFTAKDKNGNVIGTQTVTTGDTTAGYHFVKDVPGDYTVSVVINTDKGVATGTCVKTVTVTEIPQTPVYSCDGVTVEKIGGRKVNVTVAVTNDPKARVQIKNYEYNFGDGSAAQVTDKNPNTYEYAKDGTYNVSVKVNFMVDGVMQTKNGAGCSAVIAFTTEVCKYDATLTPSDVKCKPATTLPKTGGSSTLGVFVATTMLGMLMFRGYAARKQ